MEAYFLVTSATCTDHIVTYIKITTTYFHRQSQAEPEQPEFMQLQIKFVPVTKNETINL